MKRKMLWVEKFLGDMEDKNFSSSPLDPQPSL